MDNELQLKIISQSEDTANRFANEPFTIPDTPSLPSEIRKGDVAYVPGAMGGWYELAVAVGLTALPISVFASCLANWITNVLAEPFPSPIQAKLVVRKGDLSAELELSDVDQETLIEALRAALDRVDFK